MDERLLQLYNLELRHLRETAGEFATDYPKIAGRLSLDRDGKELCPDPYVERLLEGLAFLSARVHLKLDSEFPRFTQGMLETVYPDYLCPVPSMAIVQFEPEEQEAALAPGFRVERGAVLRSQLGKGERTACTFTTAHPVRLLPLKIVQAAYFTRNLAELNLPREVSARAAFRIRLRKTIPNPFREILADPLVFFIRGADELPGRIYEQLIGHRAGLVVQSPKPGGPAGSPLPATSIRTVGFSEDQAVLPPSPNGFEGYRLLSEYFAFPDRFLFFELAGFKDSWAKMEGDEVDLVILLNDQDTGLEGQVDASCFSLFCTPAVNLFEKTLDRIQLSSRFSEFHVLPDRNRPLDFEVYRLSDVTGYGDTPDKEQAFVPFYRARDADLESGAFYTTLRAPRLKSDHERRAGRRSSYAGTDLFLSIVDGDMAPYSPDLRQIGTRALCTNRHLPIQMAKGVGRTDFTMEVSAPVNSIRTIQGPTLPRPSLVLAGMDAENPEGVSGRFAWRLISHLSLNLLSLQNRGESGADGLREILRLYADPGDRQALKQIEGVRSVRTSPLVRRLEVPGPITFARGLEIEVQFDETAFEGQGVFVLGAVLERFFAKYVSLNSFTETVISSQQRKEIMRWPTRIGSQSVL